MFKIPKVECTAEFKELTAKRVMDGQRGAHESGADVVLLGTGNPDHLAPDIDAILQPPLPAADAQKIAELFAPPPPLPHP